MSVWVVKRRLDGDEGSSAREEIDSRHDEYTAARNRVVELNEQLRTVAGAPKWYAQAEEAR